MLTTEDRQGKIATKYNSNRHATLWYDCYLFQGIATAVTPSHLCFIFINLFFTASCRLTTSWHGFPFLTHTLFHAPVTHQALRHYVCEYALQRSFLALVLHVRYWKKKTNIFKKNRLAHSAFAARHAMLHASQAKRSDRNRLMHSSYALVARVA